MANAAKKILKRPNAYVVLAVIGIGVAVVIYYKLKAPAQAAYQGAQNFDQNIGLGAFDAWVSSWFAPSAPPVN